MANYRIGETLRKCRTQLSITQEDLCDGICAVPTLSRIENGQRLPSKVIFDALMQRMGRNGDMYDALMSDHDFAIHEKKYEIRMSIIARDFDKVAALLNEYNALTKGEDEKLYRQFSMFAGAVLKSEQDDSPQEALEMLLEAVKLTVPKYGAVRLFMLYLSLDELTMINNIATMYGQMNEREDAIKLYGELEEYMDMRCMDTQEKLRVYPLIIYNHSKDLGQSERYLECIELCNKGIELCKQMDCTRLMAKFYYNRAWSMQKRGKPEQYEEAKRSVILAYILAMSVDNANQMKHYENFARENFGIELPNMFPYYRVRS